VIAVGNSDGFFAFVPAWFIAFVMSPAALSIQIAPARPGMRLEEDDGTVMIASSDEAASRRAVEMVQEITAEAEIGKIYKEKHMPFMGFIALLFALFLVFVDTQLLA